MANNKIGLEAEFLLRKNGELVYPANYGFETDDFPILGEIRALPANTRAETMANFLKVWYETVERSRAAGLDIDLSGYAEISPEKYAEILRRMGTKEVAKCANIYPETDLLHLSDAIVENGRILHHRISTGLHLHFSSLATTTKLYSRTEETFTPVTIPLSINGTNLAEMSFYQKVGEKKIEERITATASRITRPVLYDIVEFLDKNLLKKYYLGVPLKYRNPGFYEVKPYGFEYRSLPFTEEVLGDLYDIVFMCFNCLERLSIY